MLPDPPGIPLEIRRGSIYRDIYDKRAADRSTTGAADLACARAEGGRLRFGSRGERDRAMSEGVFFVRIPEGLDVAAADLFAEQFYAGPAVAPYGRFRDLDAQHFGDPLLGFHRRVDQIEQFLLERRFWRRDYPPAVRDVGEMLIELSHQVLCFALGYAGVPARDWRRATGGCTEKSGSYHLTFNHYRPARQQAGLSSHKDDGFLTLLRTVAPGLEVNRNRAWETVPARADCFIVNFGLSMEILTAGCERRVPAIMHRVAQQSRDRSSFGLFASSSCLYGADEGIYRYSPSHGLERVCGSRELIEENDHEIYEGTDAPGGEGP